MMHSIWVAWTMTEYSSVYIAAHISLAASVDQGGCSVKSEGGAASVAIHWISDKDRFTHMAFRPED